MIEKEYINSLLIRIAKEDEKALKELYEIMYPLLRSTVQKILINKENIEDVLAETYLKVYQRIGQYKMGQDGINWIFEIAKNQAIDYNRWKDREDIRPIEEISFISSQTKGRYIEKSKIKLALKTLNEEEYEVIQLKIWERWTLNEIAEKNNYSLARVFRIYNSALEKMREVLE